MIIKSMARKEGSSFADIIDYLLRDAACDQNHSLHHNLLGRTRDEVIAEFEENARHLRKRKNGNVAYHEVVSIRCVPGMNKEEQKRKLIEIAERYVEMRAPHCLVLGALHDDHDEHIHVHLLISANELGQTKRYSLTKAQFRKVTIEMERRVLADYPELKQTVAIEKEAKVKRSQKAAAMKARTGRLPKQEALATDLRGVFMSVGSIRELRAEMKQRDLQFYQRGKIVGVINTKTGKRDRLPTLGIADDYQTMAQRLSAATQEIQQEQQSKTEIRKTTYQKGDDAMDISALFQGLGAISDAVSIGVTPQVTSEEKNSTTQSRQTTADIQHTTANAKRKEIDRSQDREIIAQTRQKELAELREERERRRRRTHKRGR